jgi:hypothetical protein
MFHEIGGQEIEELWWCKISKQRVKARDQLLASRRR